MWERHRAVANSFRMVVDAARPSASSAYPPMLLSWVTIGLHGVLLSFEAAR
jgi:hypothetical protein